MQYVTTLNGHFGPQEFSSPFRTVGSRSELTFEDSRRMASRANINETTSAAQTRRHRYSRSTTASVTQLLSESCSSLLQRITTRVRGTSTATDNITASASTSSASSAALGLGTTRSRLEDKYSAVLDKYGRRREDAGTRRGGTESRRVETGSEKEVSKSPLPLTKSATTASVVLAEKAYPYVSKSSVAPVREKTPYRHGEHRLLQQQQQAYSSSHRHRHKSGQGDHSRRVPVRPVRVGRSEQGERRLLTSTLRLCPVEIEPSSIESPKQEPPIEDAVIEREVRRKEIQTLIMKYTALDEAYNKSVGEGKYTVEEPTGRVVAPEGKYYLLDDAYNRAYEAVSNKQKPLKSSNIANKYQHKYAPALVPTVSSELALKA